MSIKSASIQ